MQASLTPDQVVQILRDGNQRFCQGELLTRDLPRQRLATADAQHPLAIVLSATSSRTPVEMVFDMSLGDLFCARVSGNHVDRAVLGSLEFACVVMGAKLILVLGHSNSIIIRLAIETKLNRQGVAEATGCAHLEPVIAEIQQSVEDRSIGDWHALSPEEQQRRMQQVYQAHIERTIQRIRRESPALERLVQSKDIKIIGSIYDVVSGRVRFLETTE